MNCQDAQEISYTLKHISLGVQYEQERSIKLVCRQEF
jgi:hypothetical protein